MYFFENGEYVKYENEIEFFYHKVESLSNKYLGSISDEEDLQSKAGNAFAELISEDFVNKVESDYVEKDGIKLKLNRKHPYYTIKYYNEYDIWYIYPNPPSGITEDGKSYDVIWDVYSHLLIRGSDGKIIAACN